MQLTTRFELREMGVGTTRSPFGQVTGSSAIDNARGDTGMRQVISGTHREKLACVRPWVGTGNAVKKPSEEAKPNEHGGGVTGREGRQSIVQLGEIPTLG